MLLRSSLLLAWALKASSFEFGVIQDFSCSVEGAAGKLGPLPFAMCLPLFVTADDFVSCSSCRSRCL